MECRLRETYSLKPDSNLVISHKKRIHMHWDLPCRESRVLRTKQCLTKRPSRSVKQNKLVGYKIIYLFIHLFVVQSMSLSVFLVIDKRRSMTGQFMNNAMKSTRQERSWHNLIDWCSISLEELRQITKIRVKCTLVQALRLCTGRTAHRGSRGIALLYKH
jgi:hypothetical protein